MFINEELDFRDFLENIIIRYISYTIIILTMPYKDLISSIISKKCILFAGAGLTCETGGKLWKDLIEDLKVKFSYKGPFEDYFEILDDIMTENNPKTVYDYISGQLCNVSLSP